MTDNHAQLDAEAVGRHLALVMLFGAARADADPTQLAMLREECLPLLEDNSVPLRAVAEKVLEVMGPEWAPTGDYARIIENILAARQQGRP